MASQLNQEKICEIQEAFNLFHRTSQPGVSTKELGILLRSLGQHPTELEITEMISEIDPSNSGYFACQDFVNLISRRNQDTDSEQEIYEAFRVFDKDGQGYISSSELRHIMTSLGEKLTEAEVEDMIKESGADDLGRIYYPDFVKVIIST